MNCLQWVEPCSCTTSGGLRKIAKKQIRYFPNRITFWNVSVPASKVVPLTIKLQLTPKLLGDPPICETKALFKLRLEWSHNYFLTCFHQGTRWRPSSRMGKQLAENFSVGFFCQDPNPQGDIKKADWGKDRNSIQTGVRDDSIKLRGLFHYLTKDITKETNSTFAQTEPSPAPKEAGERRVGSYQTHTQHIWEKVLASDGGSKSMWLLTP